jgi:hypothetical protein
VLCDIMCDISNLFRLIFDVIYISALSAAVFLCRVNYAFLTFIYLIFDI